MLWFARPESNALQLRSVPRLASWEKANHPAQIRLQSFLDDTEELLDSSRIEGPWALRLDVGLPADRDLLEAGDLDNYAFPLACRLGDAGLVPPTSGADGHAIDVLEISGHVKIKYDDAIDALLCASDDTKRREDA